MRESGRLLGNQRTMPSGCQLAPGGRTGVTSRPRICWPCFAGSSAPLWPFSVSASHTSTPVGGVNLARLWRAISVYDRRSLALPRYRRVSITRFRWAAPSGADQRSIPFRHIFMGQTPCERMAPDGVRWGAAGSREAVSRGGRRRRSGVPSRPRAFSRSTVRSGGPAGCGAGLNAPTGKTGRRSLASARPLTRRAAPTSLAGRWLVPPPGRRG